MNEKNVLFYLFNINKMYEKYKIKHHIIHIRKTYQNFKNSTKNLKFFKYVKIAL